MRRWTPALFVLLLALAGVASFTVETRTHPTGMSAEAQLNPWLAAARVLERQGLVVESEPDYGGVPARTRVLLMATPLDFLSEGEREALLDWVRAGGHLVTVVPDPGLVGKDVESVLARLVDVRLLRREPGADERKAAASKSGLRTLAVEPAGHLQAGLDPRRTLRAGPGPALWRATDGAYLHGLRRAVGQGRITVFSDLEWLHNHQLGKGDHAGLLWAALDAPPRAHVLLVSGTERPSLFMLAWERAAPLLVALAIFVLAWLWQATRRFGPLRPGPPAERRRLAEHLEASGHYLYRHGGLHRLYEASRARLLARVQRRHPQWRGLPPDRLAERLAERARVEAGAVARVLGGPAPDHLLQFAADLRLLNRLRKAL